jgi:hypothetical protein
MNDPPTAASGMRPRGSSRSSGNTRNTSSVDTAQAFSIAAAGGNRARHGGRYVTNMRSLMRPGGVGYHGAARRKLSSPLQLVLLYLHLLPLPPVVPLAGAAASPAGCDDSMAECSIFATHGECKRRRAWMAERCRRSCGLCPSSSSPSSSPGSPSAAGSEARGAEGLWQRYVYEIKTASALARFRRANERAVVSHQRCMLAVWRSTT